MFQYVSGPSVCPKCRKLEEEMFQKVKDYLRKNPGAEMHRIAEETEVSVALIEKFLRQGRLEVTADSPIRLSCERCGVEITSGRMCAKCQNEIQGEINEVRKELTPEKKEEKKETSGEKMRFLKTEDLHRR